MRETCPDCGRTAILHSWLGEKRICMTCLGQAIRKQDDGSARGKAPSKNPGLGARESSARSDSSDA